MPLATLRHEERRLRQLIGLDARQTQQLTQLDKKIADAKIALRTLIESITDARGAPDRIVQVHEQRREAYARVFTAITNEEYQLRQLYEPLAAILAETGGLIDKLAFSVKRVVDVDRWADRAEQHPARPAQNR